MVAVINHKPCLTAIDTDILAGDETSLVGCQKQHHIGDVQRISHTACGLLNGIGKCIAEEFMKQGAHVCVIDCAEGDHYVGDIADKATLEDFARTVIQKYGKVDVLVNNAPPGFRGIDECTYEQFQRSMAIGVTAPFYLSKLFAPYFAEGASIINISSSRDRMSQPQSESYTAAKGGISA